MDLLLKKANDMDTPFQTCRTCDRPPLPLTEEFWCRNNASKTGFSLHCKACDRKYHQARKHGEVTHRGRGKKRSEAVHYDQEAFGDFELEALKDKRETLSTGIISIYQEI